MKSFTVCASDLAVLVRSINEGKVVGHGAWGMGHVGRMRRREMHLGFAYRVLVEKSEGKIHFNT
jgi:hypothetical protein